MKRNCSAFKASALALLTSLLTGSLIADPINAPVVIDTFNDGQDKFWLHCDPIAPYGTTSYSFPVGPSPFGKGYRLQCTSVPGSPSLFATARTFSYRPNVYENFLVSVDIVSWDNTLNQALVIFARGSGLDESLYPGWPLGFGTIDGYVCNYDPNQWAEWGVPGGQFQINKVIDESTITIAAFNITLDPAKMYRMIFKGVGTTLTASLYDIENLSTPLVTIEADDATYPQGVSGLVSYSRDNTVTDVTYDNYVALRLP